MKNKAKKLHQNQKYNKNTPKVENVSFELQVKNNAMRGFKKELRLINRILDTGKECCKEAAIEVACIVVDVALKH